MDDARSAGATTLSCWARDVLVAGRVSLLGLMRPDHDRLFHALCGNGRRLSIWCVALGMVLLRTDPAMGAMIPSASSSKPARQALAFDYTHRTPLARVVLHYRTSGARSFRSRELTPHGPVVTVSIPEEDVTAPGIDYYLELTGEDGEVTTDPPVYPDFNPHRIAVHERALPAFRVLGGEALGATDRIVLAWDGGESPEGFRLFLDDVDITAMADIREGHAEYRPLEPLQPGPHRLRVVRSSAGEETSSGFTVVEAEKGAAATVVALKGNASFHYGGNVSNKNSSASPLSANLHVEGDISKGKFSTHLSGVNVNYVQGAPTEVSLSSGFLMNTGVGPVDVAFGDVSVRGTPLVLSGFARRGVMLSTGVGKGRAELFTVSTDPVEGFNGGVNIRSSADQTYGVFYQAALLPDDRLTVGVSGVAGNQEGGAGTGVASLRPAARGRTLGAVVSGSLAGFKVDMEYAWSRYDPDRFDGVDAKEDAVYEARLSHALGGVTIGGGYRRYGSDYATIANPSFSGDREGYDLSLAGGIGVLSWSLSGSHTVDNVNRDPSRPRVRSTGGHINLGLSPEGWPSLQLGLGRSLQKAGQVPAGDTGVDNIDDTVSLALSHAGGVWSTSLTASLGWLDDRLATNVDRLTQNYGLSMSYRLDPVSIAPSVSYNASKGSGRVQRSWLLALNLSVPLWSDRITLSTQASYQHSTSSDDSVDQDLANGSIRIAWTLQDLFTHRIPDWLNAQFGLSGTFNRLNDRVNPAAGQNTYAVLLTFSMGAPYNFGLERSF